MPQLPALAYGFSASFKIRELLTCFAGATVRAAKKQVVAEYGPDRFAVGFDFGAVVFINVGDEERARVIATIREKLAREEPHAPLEEDFLIEVRADAPATGEVRFDRVVLRELTPAGVEVITLLLAQSVAIDYYEEDLQEILAALDRRTDRMKRTGRLGGSTREMARFVASAIDTKNQILGVLAVLDKPALTWEAESVNRLFRAFREMLEIEDRFRALEYKLRTIQESLELFLDLAQSRRMMTLEAVVVLLILGEILLTLLQRVH